MAFTELEIARLRRTVGAWVEQRRPLPHIRPELDFGYRISGQSVEIFEIRPVWRGAPGEKMELAVAKATYVKSKHLWKVYWQRADMKWHAYQPTPEAASIEDFLALVSKDEYACFFG